MSTTTTRPPAWAEATSILGEAWRFFVRHLPVVLALGVLASAQRFLSVGGLAPWAGGAAGEIFTGTVRVVFVVWVVRRLARTHGIDWSRAGERWSAWFTRHGSAVLASLVYLAALLLVAKVVPDALAGRVGGVDRPTYLAAELAIKNVTVIPFTMIWMTLLTVVRPVAEGGDRED